MSSSTAESRITAGEGPLFAPLAFSDAEYERRLDGVRGRMRELEVDAFITFGPENIYYLTGHDTPGYYWYQASVVTHDHPPVNVIRKLEATNTLWRSWKRLVVGYEDTEDPVDATLDLLAELGVKGRVGTESDGFFVTPQQYAALRSGIEGAGNEQVDTTGVVESMRVVKSGEELVYVRRGAPAVQAALHSAFEAAAEGVTERYVAARAIKSLVDRGSSYVGLPPFLPTGNRATLSHSTWSDKVLAKGDYLSYEVAATVERYACAMFRMGIVGPPDDAFTRRMEACKEALAGILDAVRPGVTAGEVFEAGNQGFLRNGFDDGLGRRLGYSVGVNYPPDWGEGHIIDLRKGSEKVLRPGMCFHTTPGLIEPGRGVVNISETFIVTEDGCEVVTDAMPVDAVVV